MDSQFFIFLLLLRVVVQGKMDTETRFDQNYEVIWGDDHVVSLNQGRQIQLTMDNSSG